MQPREALAVIRRIDTDGDAAVSFAEFADFIRVQCNAAAPFTTEESEKPKAR